jgi:hypothetical protein
MLIKNYFHGSFSQNGWKKLLQQHNFCLTSSALTIIILSNIIELPSVGRIEKNENQSKIG